MTYTKTGDLVHVPASWAHSVRNIAPNVKIVFDVYDSSRYHLYAQTAALLSKHFWKTNVDDYMRVTDVFQEGMHMS